MKKVRVSSRTLGAAVILAASFSAKAVEVKFKGFVKAEVIHSDSSVGSFSDSYTHTAITRANKIDDTPDQTNKYEKSEATSFQVSQSRFGVEITEGKTTGIFEFDLIDPGAGFTNTTALQASGPRTRLAYIVHKVDDSLSLFMGQKWSTATGIASTGTYNFVGNGYQAGKVSFLNQELGLKYVFSDFSVTAALSGKGRNTVAVNENELGSAPGYAVSAEYKKEKFMVGLAAHGAKLVIEDSLTPTPAPSKTRTDRESLITKIYSSVGFSSFRLDAEAYTGKNVSNLNAFGIGSATTGTRNMEEWGYWTALTYDATKEDVVRLGHGKAQVDEDSESSLSATEMQENSYVFINYGRSLGDGLTAFAQYTRYDTTYGTGGTEEKFDAGVTQLGMLYKF